jgi:hypothetical protein
MRAMSMQHEVEEKVRKLMADLNDNDMVKAIVPYVTKAAFGAAVGVAAHRMTEDRLVCCRTCYPLFLMVVASCPCFFDEESELVLSTILFASSSCGS